MQLSAFVEMPCRFFTALRAKSSKPCLSKFNVESLASTAANHPDCSSIPHDPMRLFDHLPTKESTIIYFAPFIKYVVFVFS
jgi:hypothetical protein